MSQGWLLLLALLVGMGLGISIQLFINVLDVIRDPDAFEESASRAAASARALRAKLGR